MKVPFNTYCSIEIRNSLDKYIENTGETLVSIVEKALTDFLNKDIVPEKKPTIKISNKFMHLDLVALSCINSDRVELSFNPEDNLLFIKPTENEGYKISKDNRIWAQGFFSKNNISVKGRYVARCNTQEGILEINLRSSQVDDK